MPVALRSGAVAVQPAVDCAQLAAAVGPASLLAGGKLVSLTQVAVHEAASCHHHSGSKLPAVHGEKCPAEIPNFIRPNLRLAAGCTRPRDENAAMILRPTRTFRLPWRAGIAKVASFDEAR